MKTKLVYLHWFLTTMNYSISPNETTPAEKLKRAPTQTEIAGSVRYYQYCRNNESPEEVEKLLDFDAKFTQAVPNWWRARNFVLHFFKQTTKPNCSVPPNSLRSTKRISDFEYFRSRGISIPSGEGKKVRLVNVFEHVKRKSIRRIMLVCDCHTENKSTDICPDGKTVVLSRGVGGDKSFFVHIPTPKEGEYKVVAHVCGR